MAAAASSRERWSILSATMRQAAALATLLLLLVSSLSLVPAARAGDPEDGDEDGDLEDPCVPFFRNDDENECFNVLTVSPTDCDRDGKSNVQEILAGDEPCGPESTLQDTDGDSWQDRVESLLNHENQELSNKNSAQSTPFTDDDADGCVNLIEWAAGTSRTNPADKPQEQACGGPAFRRPGVSITSVDGALPTVRPDGTLLVTGHKDRSVTIVGTSSPGRLLDQDRAVTAVLLNYNDRAADRQCVTVATTPPTTECRDPPRSYNGNENTRANILGGRYWKIVNATGPASAPFATWTITLDLQGTDIPRDDGAYEIPVTVIAYDGPFNRGYVPGTETVADGTCGVASGTTCVGKRDTRVPLVPLEGSPEWSDPVHLALQFVQDHVPVLNLVGLGAQGPTKRTTNTITASYVDSDDKADKAWLLVCKAKTGTCDDKATDPAPQWVACESSDGVWDTNVSLECDWTPPVAEQPPTDTYYLRAAVVDERGYNTTVENGAFKFTNVVARIANEVAINGNITSRVVREELVTLSGRIVDHDGTGNTLEHVQVTVKDKIPGQTTTPKVDEIVVNPADITDCTPSGGARTYCWTAPWNVSTYAAHYSEANDLRIDVNGTDSEGFPLESDLSNAIRDVTLSRNTPPVVTFGAIELDNGTVYQYDATTGNWTTNGTDVGPNPDVYGAFNVTLVVEDVDNVRPAWSQSRLDEVKVSLGKGEAPFVVTTPAQRREATPFEDLGLEEIHVQGKRLCSEMNAVTSQAGDDACTYSYNKVSSGRACTDAPGTDPQKDLDRVECTIDTSRAWYTGDVHVTHVPGYILTSRGTIVLGADTVLLSAGFAQCVEDRAAEVRDLAEGSSAAPPATCQVDENSIDGSDADGNVDVQFGPDAMQVICQNVYTLPPPPDSTVPPLNAPGNCPPVTTSALTSVVRSWLLGVTLNEGEVLVGVSTVCSTSSATSSPWCSTAVRNRPGDELEVRDYRLGDNDGAKDGDEYDQIDRSFSRTTTDCEKTNKFPSNGWPPAVPPGTLPDPLVPEQNICPFAATALEDRRPLSENDAPDCGDLEPVPGVLEDPCVIPFGQLADDLGINGIQVPVTVDGVTLMGYLVTPSDYSKLLGNAVCFFGTTVNREPKDPAHFNCGSPKDSPGRVGGGQLLNNETMGYLDHRKPAAVFGGEAGADVGALFRGIRDPSASQSPKWAIPRGFNFQPANNTTGLDANVTEWVASINASGPAKNDGVRSLFAVAFDGVEDFGTTPICVPAQCTPSVAPFVNNGRDRDRDGYKDADERAAGSDPHDADSVPADQDEDFIPDAVDDDIDGDGVDNDDEESGYAIQYPPQRAGQVKKTDANVSDTDGDGYSDGSERENLTDPTDASVHPDDLDGDGFFNDDEDLNRELFGTNGRADSGRTPADNDGDGFYDWEELVAGTDPFNASDKPAAGNAFYDLDKDRDRVPDALEPTLCGADPDACFAGDYVPRLDVDRQVFEPAFQSAYAAASCPALLAGGALSDAVGGTLPTGDAATAAAVRCVTMATGRVSATFGVFDPQVRPNAFNSFTVYNDVDHDAEVDAGEELATTPPANPKVQANPDGSRTVYNDRNGDGHVDVGEEQVTTAGANPKTQTNPDGTTTVYNDKNNNNQTDPGEESATVTPNPCPANTCPLPTSTGANNLVVRLRVLTPGNPSADPDGVAVGKASGGQFSFEVTLWNARCEAVPFSSVELRYRVLGSTSAAEWTLGNKPNAEGDNSLVVTAPANFFDPSVSLSNNRGVLMRGLFNGGTTVNGWVSPSAAKLQLAGACALADILDSQPTVLVLQTS